MEESEPAKVYENPKSFQGTYVEWKWDRADAAKTTVTQSHVNFDAPAPFTAANGKFTDMPASATEEFVLNAEKTKVDCSDSAGPCVFTYHFRRTFDGAVPLEAAVERMYDFYVFY